MSQDSLTTLSGSTITLDCEPPTPSYSGAFEWRFYSSVSGERIYSQHPDSFNEDHFPASRYRQVDSYGLEISSVDWRDGGVYGCRFYTGDVIKLTSVVVIGESLMYTVCMYACTCMYVCMYKLTSVVVTSGS